MRMRARVPCLHAPHLTMWRASTGPRALCRSAWHAPTPRHMAALAPPAVADAPCSPTHPRALPQPRHVPRLPTPHFAPLGPSRAPLLSTQQMVADEQLAGWGGQWGVSAGEQVGRLVGWGGSGCRGIARGPQAPVELCCCLCLRRWPQVPPCLYRAGTSQSSNTDFQKLHLAVIDITDGWNGVVMVRR